MRWRIPLVVSLALLVVVSCNEQPPTAVVEDSAVTTPVLAAGGLGAVVTLGDIGCYSIDGNGDYYPPTFDGSCFRETATYSQNGNSTWTMRMSGVPNPTGKTIHYGPYFVGSGQAAADYSFLDPGPYPCAVLGPDRDFDNFLYTTNWRQILTPSGEAITTCIYSEKFAWQFPD